MKPTEQLMLKSFPKDERLKLPIYKGVFNWAARKPIVPITALTFGAASSPLEAAEIATALMASWAAVAIVIWRTTGVTPNSLRGQWHDRAINRLISENNKDGTPKYSENSPKVMAHMLHASAHRASHAHLNGFTNIL